MSEEGRGPSSQARLARMVHNGVFFTPKAYMYAPRGQKKSIAKQN